MPLWQLNVAHVLTTLVVYGTGKRSQDGLMLNLAIHLHDMNHKECKYVNNNAFW